MKQFQYTITVPMGLHARPAGALVKMTKSLDSTITIVKEDGQSADAARLMALMTLAVKTGQTVTVTVEGGQEDINFAAMERFFRENL